MADYLAGIDEAVALLRERIEDAVAAAAMPEADGVTLGEMIDGNANFDTGETFSCAKGEALYHSRGGVLQCRLQVAERNCNERSLLRKFGPGVKLVNMPVKKTICEPAKRETITKVVKEVKVPRPVVAGDLVLDGGVGQGY